MLKKIEKFLGYNPLDILARQWEKKSKTKILLLWNRGLGDIPLWLYGLFYQIRQNMDAPELYVLTRSDLYEGFLLLHDIKILVSPTMRRGDLVSISNELAPLGYSQDFFHIILETIHPKPWLKWQRGWVTPRLVFDNAMLDVGQKFGLQGNNYLGVHLSSETGAFYKDEKNWPLENFHALFERIMKETSQKIILFGLEKKGTFSSEIIDLRGSTSLLDTLGIIKSCCTSLLAPDSGILCMVYYLDCDFPLSIVSLWGNPNVGVLKQRVKSPNKLLKHTPIIGKKHLIKNIEVDKVFKILQRNEHKGAFT